MGKVKRVIKAGVRGFDKGAKYGEMIGKAAGKCGVPGVEAIVNVGVRTANAGIEAVKEATKKNHHNNYNHHHNNNNNYHSNNNNHKSNNYNSGKKYGK